MFALTNKPEMGARLYQGLIEQACDPEKGTDAMQLIMHISGVLVETYLLFENPDDAMEASFYQLCALLQSEPYAGELSPKALPPAHSIDCETERGRLIARKFFEEWLDCSYEFHNLMLVILHNVFVRLEEEGLSRAESLRLLVECTRICMFYEIASQELCDVVIDLKIGQENWSIGDCVAGLSAIAGQKLALSLSVQSCLIFNGADIPDHLDQIAHVMTQEAVRLGVPAGTDWRFGLAANDVPLNAPISLVEGIQPFCQSFFSVLDVQDPYLQAVSCAKAAGRMVAVAAGGELPELEPVIAKPLAMAAMTETYKSVCIDYSLATY